MLATFEPIQSNQGSSFSMKALKLRRFDAPWHYHPEIELTLIQSSHGQRFVGDNIQTFAPGDLVMVGPNLPHYWNNSGKVPAKKDYARAIVVQFRENFLGDHSLHLPELKSVVSLFNRSKRGIRFNGSIVRNVENQLTNLLNQKGAKLLGTLLNLLEDLSRCRSYELLSSEGFRPTLDTTAHDRINRCHNYVFRNFRDSIKLAGAAKASGMSPQAFSRYFKQVTGNTFSKFVNEVRIGHACRLLAESDLSVSEIAYECGFGSLSNFNRRFLERKSSTPTAFRTQFRPV